MAVLEVNDMPAIVAEALVTPENNVVDLKVPLEFPITVRCTVNTGSIRFSQAGAANGGNPLVASTESIEMSLIRPDQLNFLATAQNNDFKIEVIRQRGQ